MRAHPGGMARKNGNVLMTPSNFLPASTGPHGRIVPVDLRPSQQKCPISVPSGNHSEYQNIVPSVCSFVSRADGSIPQLFKNYPTKLTTKTHHRVKLVTFAV
jgi:hypothetical protein